MEKIKKILLALRLITVAICVMLAMDVCGKPFVVVIDAGHGGHDYGALGEKVNEKTINLNVALKLGELIENNLDNVKVVYTRKGDYFLSLQQRANVANKANGDLFISIHTNSVDKSSKNRTSVNGAATYTLGMHKTEENLAVAKRENAVMKLEKDYSTKYEGFDPNSTESYIIFEINQSKHVEQSVDFASRVQREMVKVAGRKNNGVRQAGFWVLAKTSMPAVLVELDFICNPTSEKFLGSDDGQMKFAQSIFNALRSYQKSYYSASDKDSKIKVKKSADGSQADEQQEQEKSDTKQTKSRADKKQKKEKKNKVATDELYEADAAAVSENEDKPKETSCDEGVRYKVQFMVSSKKLKSSDSRLKDVDDVNYYYEKGLYKYTSGCVSDKKDALSLQRQMRKRFPEAFVVEFKDGKRVK